MRKTERLFWRSGCLLLCWLALSAVCAADSVVHEREAMFGTIVVT